MITKKTNVKTFITPISKEELIQRLNEIDYSTLLTENDKQQFKSQKKFTIYFNKNIDKYLWLIDKYYTSQYFWKNDDGLLKISYNQIKDVINSRNHKIKSHLEAIGLIVKMKGHKAGEYAEGYILTESGFFINEVEVTDEEWFSKIKCNTGINITDEFTESIFNTSKNLEINYSTLNDKEKMFLFMKEHYPFISRSYKNDRINHSFANLPSDMRKKFKLNGEALKYFDLSNSQALFFVQLIKRKLKEFNQNISIKTKKFISLIENGRIYNSIAKDMKITRDEAKDLYMILMYSSKEEGVIQTYIKDNYKQVFSVIQKYKEDDSANLAVLLQKTEADFIYSICNKFDFEYLTAHDSIYVSESNFEKLIEYTRDEFNDYGLNGTIKINDTERLKIESIDFSPSNVSKIKNDTLVKEKAFELTDVPKLDTEDDFGAFDIPEVKPAIEMFKFQIDPNDSAGKIFIDSLKFNGIYFSINSDSIEIPVKDKPFVIASAKEYFNKQRAR